MQQRYRAKHKTAQKKTDQTAISHCLIMAQKLITIRRVQRHTIQFLLLVIFVTSLNNEKLQSYCLVFTLHVYNFANDVCFQINRIYNMQ